MGDALMEKGEGQDSCIDFSPRDLLPFHKKMVAAKEDAAFDVSAELLSLEACNSAHQEVFCITVKVHTIRS